MVLLKKYNLVNVITSAFTVQWNDDVPTVYPGTADSIDYDMTYIIESLSFGAINTAINNITLSASTSRLNYADTSSNSITFTLPLAATYPSQSYFFKKISSANSMIIASTGGELIDGAITQTFTTVNSVYTITSDGINSWSINPDIVSNVNPNINDPVEAATGNIDHNALGNLTTGDAHTQYTLLDGRNPGQILSGSNIASGTLTLRGTSTNTSGSVLITTDTESSSTSTGSLIISGGIGIAKKAYLSSMYSGIIDINGTNPNTISSSGELTLVGTTVSTANPVTFTNTTASNSTSSGALIISGGLGVFGQVTGGTLASGNIQINSNTITSIAELNLTTTNSDIFINPGTGGFVKLTNNINSTSTSSGALIITGGLGVGNRITSGSVYSGTIDINGTSLGSITSSGVLTLTGTTVTSANPITFTNGTNSTSTSTGTLIITGGIGVSGQITSNSLSDGTLTMNSGIITSTSNITLTATPDITGQVIVTNTTPSTSVLSGALIIAGGLGVAERATVGSIYAGIININGTTPGSITSSGVLTLTGTTVTSANPITFTNGVASLSTLTGTLVVTGGIGVSGRVTAGNFVAGTIDVNATTAGSITSSANLTLTASPLATGVVLISNTLASSTTLTGALRVAGGVGVVGRVSAGSLSANTITLNVTANTITNTSALTVSSTAAVIITGGTTLALNSSTTNNITITAGTTGTLQIAAATRQVINNVSAASTLNTSALAVLGGANIQLTLIVGSTANNLTVRGGAGTTGITSNTSLILTSTNGITLTSGNSIITAGSLSFTTSANAAIIGGTTLTLNGTSSETGGTINLRGNATDTTGTVAIIPTTAGGVGTGALTVAGGVSIADSLFIGANVSVNNSSLTSTSALSITSGNNSNLTLTTGGGTGIITCPRKATFTENVASTSVGTGSLIVTGGISVTSTSYFGGRIEIIDETEATTSTGSIVTAGGISLAKALFVGPNISINNSSITSTVGLILTTSINNDLTLTTGGGTGIITSDRQLSFTLGTASSSTTTGTLIVSGGVGVSNTSYFGGALFNTSNIASINTTSGAIVVTGGVGISGNLNVGGITSFSSLTLTGNVASTNPTSGTLIITGGLGITGAINTDGAITTNGIITITNTTNSSLFTNGSLVLSGGLGVALNSNFNGNIGIAGITTINNTTESTSTTTGALIVSGGVGIAKQLNVDGITTITSATISTSTSTGALVLTEANAGIGVPGNAYIGGIINNTNLTGSTSTITGAITTAGGIGITENAYIGGTINNTNTTESTSTSSGAIITSGGIGIAKNAYIGGNIVMAALATVDGVDVSVLESRVVTLEAVPKGFGRTIRVDSINGSDSTGTRNGLAFLTIAGALAATGLTSGDIILIYPGTYTISTTIAIPTGVSIVGIDRNNVIINWTGITVSSTMVTMSSNSKLQSLTLVMTSITANVSLTGISITDTNASIDDVTITTDNSGSSGTMNNYTLLSSGTTTLPGNYQYPIRNSEFICKSTAAGTKRALLVDGNNTIFAKNCQFFASRAAGVGSTGSVESNSASALIQLYSCHIEGQDFDISKTLGTLRIASCILYNANSNALNFNVLNFTNSFTFSDPGTIGNDATRHFYICQNVTSNLIQYAIFKPTIIKNLTINVRVAPGTGRSSIFTLLKNGVATTLTATLSGTATTVSNTFNAVSYTTGDLFALRHTGTGNTNTADSIIQIELYG